MATKTNWLGTGAGYFGGGLGGASLGTMLLPGVGTAIGAGVGAIGGGLFGSGIFDKNSSNQEYDYLAGIRAQLQNLAGQVPALVAKQKELTAQNIATAKTEGTQSIGEDVYATRGLGRTSIYDRLRTELIDKLAKTQAEADLQAEMGGLKMQGGFLSEAAGINMPQEQPSFLSQALGLGANLIGQQYGLSRLENIFNPKTPPSTNRGYLTGNLADEYRMIKPTFELGNKYPYFLGKNLGE